MKREQLVMRDTDPATEMAWLVMVTDDGGTETEWCATSQLAEKFARQALEDARKYDYEIHVYVLKCVRQNGDNQ